MKRLLMLPLLALALAACGQWDGENEDPAASEVVETAPVVPAGYVAHGDVVAIDGAIPVQVIAAEPDAYVGQTVTVEGTVAEVCRMQGCWLTLDAGPEADPIRILVDKGAEGAYRYTVPTDISGRRVVVRGTLHRAELGADEQAHLAEDAGETVDAEALAPRGELRLTADGVLVEDAPERADEDAAAPTDNTDA